MENWGCTDCEERFWRAGLLDIWKFSTRISCLAILSSSLLLVCKWSGACQAPRDPPMEFLPEEGAGSWENRAQAMAEGWSLKNRAKQEEAESTKQGRAEQLGFRGSTLRPEREDLGAH